MITYRRPTTLDKRYRTKKTLLKNKTRKQAKGDSRRCKRCALCGCYGKNNKSTVPNVSRLRTNNKTFPLNQILTCINFGM